MPAASKEIEFDAGHRVMTHEGQCRFLHGHRYKVRATIVGRINENPRSPEFGMLKDFGFLKKLMMEKIHGVLDHRTMIYNHDSEMWKVLNPVREEWKLVNFPYIPTAENIARWCFEQISYDIVSSGFQLAGVEVWETPTSVAVYSVNDVI